MGLVKTSFSSLKINTLCSAKSRPAQTHTHTACAHSSGALARPPRGLSFLVGVTNGSQKVSLPSKYSVIKVSGNAPTGGNHTPARNPQTGESDRAPHRGPAEASCFPTSRPWPWSPDLSQPCVALVLHGSRRFPPTAVSPGLGAAESWRCRGPSVLPVQVTRGCRERRAGSRELDGNPPPRPAVPGPLSADLPKAQSGQRDPVRGSLVAARTPRGPPSERLLRPTQQGPRHGPEISEPPFRARLTLGRWPTAHRHRPPPWRVECLKTHCHPQLSVQLKVRP